MTAFDQISGDPRVQQGLRELYGEVDRIELYPGLFAEDPRPNSVLPSLIGRMVGVDAFSQALTNPLLAPRVYNEATFSAEGMDVILVMPDAGNSWYVNWAKSDEGQKNGWTHGPPET